MLFSLLDYETDSNLLSDIHDALTSIMQAMAAENLTSWLALCREVLANCAADEAASSGAGSGHLVKEDSNTESIDANDDEEDRDAHDDSEFTFGEDPEAARRALMIQPRWATRVFAAQCLRKIIQGKEKAQQHRVDGY